MESFTEWTRWLSPRLFILLTAHFSGVFCDFGYLTFVLFLCVSVLYLLFSVLGYLTLFQLFSTVDLTLVISLGAGKYVQNALMRRTNSL